MPQKHPSQSLYLMKRIFNAEQLKKKSVVIGCSDSNRLILYNIVLYSKPRFSYNLVAGS